MCLPARTSARRFSRRPAGIALALALAAPLGVAASSDSAASPTGPTPPGNTAHANTAPADASPPAHASTAPAHRAKPVKRASFGQRTMTVAAEYKGVPYRRGGTTPRGFDCSGFTRHVYAELHKRIPRTSQQQFSRADRVKHPRVGDLIFYHSSRGGSVYHVAIYAGHGQVWHSPRPGERVRKGKIYAPYWTAGRY